MAEELDSYVKNMLEARYNIVKRSLRSIADCIEKIVEALKEYETMMGISSERF